MAMIYKQKKLIYRIKYNTTNVYCKSNEYKTSVIINLEQFLCLVVTVKIL